MAESSIEDKWRMVVHCEYYGTSKEQILSATYFLADAPVVQLKIGANLNANDIKEGDDVYFECHIQANPKPYKITWFHNVREMTCQYSTLNSWSHRTLQGTEVHHNTSVGVILSDQSLVLQSVTRRLAGGYACQATNSEGKTTSKAVRLHVRCK